MKFSSISISLLVITLTIRHVAPVTLPSEEDPNIGNVRNKTPSIGEASATITGTTMNIAIPFRGDYSEKMVASRVKQNFKWYRYTQNCQIEIEDIPVQSSFKYNNSQGYLFYNIQLTNIDTCLKLDINLAADSKQVKNGLFRSFAWGIPEIAKPVTPTYVHYKTDSKRNLAAFYYKSLPSNSLMIVPNYSLKITRINLISLSMQEDPIKFNKKSRFAIRSSPTEVACIFSPQKLSITQVMTNKIYDFLWNNPKYSKLSSPVYWDSTGACRVVSHIFCDKYAGDYPCKIVKDGHSNTSSPEDKTIILQKYGDEDLKIIEVIDQDDRQFYLPMLPDGTTNETIAIRCPSDVFNSNATSKYQDPTKGSIINLQPAKLVISILPTSKSPSTTDGYSNKTTSAKLTSILSDTTPKSDAQTDQIKYIFAAILAPLSIIVILVLVYICRSKSPKPIPEPTPPFFPIQPVSPNEPQVSESDLSLGQTGRPPTENFPNTADYGHANNHIDPDAMDNYGRPTMLNNHPENNLHGDGENITTTNQSLGCPQCITHHALYKKSGKTTEGDYEENVFCGCECHCIQRSAIEDISTYSQYKETIV